MSQKHKVFHAGEVAVQQRANVPSEWTEHVSEYIRPTLNSQHRNFFENQSVLFLGLLDGEGRPWSVPVFGEVGFATTPDAGHLTLLKPPVLSDNLELNTKAGAKIALVGVELSTRRRNRLNGTISEATETELNIAVDQSYGNCPQYIQMRSVKWDSKPNPNPKIQSLLKFDSPAREIVEKADTFFIASRAAELSDNPKSGVDVSHRGGKVGFVAINEEGCLSFPDFSGNRFFNTLGNIESDGRVGLFIPDFNTGNAVFITGRATIDWTPERVNAFAGAQRIIDVMPDDIVYAEQVIPGQGQLIEQSPVLAATGSWEQARLRGLKNEGYRRFHVTARKKESNVITSFHLEPADGGVLEAHVAGQFLPVRLKGGDNPLLRSYQ